MSPQAILLLPAGAALLYVLGALFIKRAMTAGCRQAHVNLVVNLLPAMVFQLLWLGVASVDWAQVWKPVLCGAFFFLGQILTFLALRNGEVSVTTPILGTKVVFTAVMGALLLGQSLALQWWLGALACSLGVMLVTGATLRSLLPRLGQRDAVFALGASLAFALTDVLVQHWMRAFGISAFIAVLFGVTGVLCLFRFGGGAFRPMPRRALAPLLAGTFFYSAQILGMAVALGLHESATVVNIVYGSRAVWSVVLAWALARFLQAEESHDARAVLLRRLAGSLLIFGAVLAVLV